jgi:outer membrane immunogenic protein
VSKSVVRALLFASATLAAQGVSRPASAGYLDPPPAYPPSTAPAPGYPAVAYPAPVGNGLEPPPAYAPPPVYDWTGFYIGVNGGGASGRLDWVSDPDLTSGNASHSAGLVGVTIGYNMQNLGHLGPGQLVVGEEFDFNWRQYSYVIPAATCGPTCSLDSDWFATARLRLGYQVDRFLPYITGGVSMADLDAYAIGQPNGVNRNVSFNFTAGAGVEAVIAGPFTGKVEYLYVNHSRIDCIVECNGPVHITPSENVFRIGLNYRLWQR